MCIYILSNRFYIHIYPIYNISIMCMYLAHISHICTYVYIHMKFVYKYITYISCI